MLSYLPWIKTTQSSDKSTDKNINQKYEHFVCIIVDCLLSLSLTVLTVDYQKQFISISLKVTQEVHMSFLSFFFEFSEFFWLEAL